MRTIVHTALAAAAFAVAILPAAGANAMPAIQPIPLAESAPAIVLTSGGCGPFRHRGFYGFCRPNFVGYGYAPVYGFRRYGFRGYGWHRWGGWRRF